MSRTRDGFRADREPLDPGQQTLAWFSHGPGGIAVAVLAIVLVILLAGSPDGWF